MIGKILVGTDGSGTAAAAVTHAVGLAKATGAELLVVSAYEMPKETGNPLTAPTGPPPLDRAKGLLEDVEKRYGDAVSLRAISREGSPSDALLEMAEEESVDLVVVGNRGMTGAKRFVLGSVPNAVSHHAPCNVLIVHTTDE